MKKKPFLLLEVLIALFLVVSIGIPLITKPIFIYRAELFALEEMEAERLADSTFVEIKESFLNHKIGWEKLPKNGEKRSFDLPPALLDLPSKKLIERRFTLSCSKEKATETQLYRFLTVEISLLNKSYKYFLIVEQRSGTINEKQA